MLRDRINERFTVFDIFFVILAGLPLLADKKWMYQLFGGIVSFICLYVLLAVFVSHVKDAQQALLQPMWTYGMGYALSLLTLCFGLLMTGIINLNLKKNSSIARKFNVFNYRYRK